MKCITFHMLVLCILPVMISQSYCLLPLLLIVHILQQLFACLLLPFESLYSRISSINLPLHCPFVSCFFILLPHVFAPDVFQPFHGFNMPNSWCCWIVCPLTAFDHNAGAPLRSDADAFHLPVPFLHGLLIAVASLDPDRVRIKEAVLVLVVCEEAPFPVITGYADLAPAKRTRHQLWIYHSCSPSFALTFFYFRASFFEPFTKPVCV